MTEENKQEETTEETKSETKVEETVSMQHHNAVKADMMKYKSEKRDLKDRLDAIEKSQKASEAAQLEKDSDWEKLAKLKDVELQKLLSENERSQELMVNSHKKAAVISVIGSFVKASYADIAINLDNILMVDGIIDEASLEAECTRVKKDHGVLLKKTFTANLPNEAPHGGTADVSYKDMNASQKAELRQQMVLNRINKPN